MQNRTIVSSLRNKTVFAESDSKRAIELKKIVDDVSEIIKDEYHKILEDIKIYYVDGSSGDAISRMYQGEKQIIIFDNFIEILRNLIYMRMIIRRIKDEEFWSASIVMLTHYILCGQYELNIEKIATEKEANEAEYHITVATYILLAHECCHIVQVEQLNYNREMKFSKNILIQNELEADLFAIRTIKDKYQKSFFSSFILLTYAYKTLENIYSIKDSNHPKLNTRLEFLKDKLMDHDYERELDDIIQNIVDIECRSYDKVQLNRSYNPKDDLIYNNVFKSMSIDEAKNIMCKYI